MAEREMGLSGGGMEMTLHFRVEQMGGNDATDSVREAKHWDISPFNSSVFILR